MDRTLILLHRAARWLVLAGVVISPWLFGSAETWACVVVGTLALLGAGFWLFSLVRYPSQTIRLPGITLLLGLLMLLVVLQILPLPAGLARRVSPMSVDVTTVCRDVMVKNGLDADTMVPLPAGRMTLSVSPDETRSSAVVFMFYLAAFLVMLNCTNTWHELRQEARVIVICGFVLAVVSLIHKLSGSSEMFWFHTPRYGGTFFGPFTNRNHFALHMEMIFGLAVGLFLASTSFREVYEQEDWRSKLAWLSTKQASQTGLLVFAIVLVGGTVVVTLSRGATMSLMAAVTAVSFLAAFRESDRRRGKIILALGLLVGGVVLWLGWQPVVDRLSTLVDFTLDPTSGSRKATTQDTLLILGAFPFAGSGFGTFRHIFPCFARPELQFGRFLHAHNDWAELLAEGGFIAGLLSLLVLFLFVRHFVGHFPLIRVHARRFVLGCLIAMGAVFLHSFVDYGLHKPANVFLLVVVCGMTLAALHFEVIPGVEKEVAEPEEDIPAPGEDLSELEESVEQPEEEGALEEVDDWSDEELPARSVVVRVIACILLIVVTVVTIRGATCFRGSLCFKRLEHAERFYGRLKDPAQMEQTARAGLDEVDGVMKDGDPDQLREMAEVFFTWAIDRRLQPEIRVDLSRSCMDSATRAVLAAPSDYLAWLWLARPRR